MQDSSVLVIGDSHVRRMAEFSEVLGDIMPGVHIEWCHQGGATLRFAEERVRSAEGHRLVVLMVGGNDLANGTEVAEIEERLDKLAERFLLIQGIDAVIIPSLWPRSDAAFNRRARTLSERLRSRYNRDPVKTFWTWDRRLPMRTYDGVHLMLNGYRRAARYLASPILWAIRHRQW